MKQFMEPRDIPVFATMFHPLSGLPHEQVWNCGECAGGSFSSEVGGTQTIADELRGLLKIVQLLESFGFFLVQGDIVILLQLTQGICKNQPI